MSELLFIEQAPSEGKEHVFESGTTIGREGCDIVFTDPDVSRRHAAIQVIRGEVSIEDLGSTNGTYVNGARIEERRRLGDGDEIKIGSIVLILRAPSAATRLVDTPIDRPSGATRMSQTRSAQPTGGEPAVAEPPTAERQPTAAQPAAPQPAAAAEPPTPPIPEPPAPEPPPSPEPPAAARPAEQPAARPGDGRRGDVPLPDFQPSAIRRVVPGADTPTAFTPATASRRKGSAATRMGATIMAGTVIALTTAGVLVYYITEPFK